MTGPKLETMAKLTDDERAEVMRTWQAAAHHTLTAVVKLIDDGRMRTAAEVRGAIKARITAMERMSTRPLGREETA